jgi:hypothetical protein
VVASAKAADDDSSVEYGTSKQVEAVVGGVSGRSESLMLADCRHAPHVDQREAVESAIARFVSRHL